MAKPRTTKTLGPLHFEDLEPHRFEDLIRELAYDYKDWQSIEATGRSGSDEGWDIRAYERTLPPDLETDAESEEPETPTHLMDGNAWMIQAKREKSLGPSDVKRIVSEVDNENPPHGYILAAPANFSKKSYDTFRSELRAKGVREFYVWGRAELEDMLYMPKNDRVLFAFFGISLSSKRRSRTTEVRAAIAVKNKLYRALGQGDHLYKEVLIRDLADTYYPYHTQYPDFAKYRRWRQLTASSHHPIGLWFHVHRYYAYVDLARKEWDFTPAVDLCDDEHNLRQSEEERQKFQEKQWPVLEAWEFLPKARQAMLTVDGLLPYSNIATVDEKGDVLYECPHIFVDFGPRGPFDGWWQALEIGGQTVHLTEKFKRITVFPKTFTIEPPHTATSSISVDQQTVKEFGEYKDLGVLFAIDKKYKKLKARDVVSVKDAAPKSGQELILQITYIGRAKVSDYLSEVKESWKHRAVINTQVGRDVADDETVTYVEYKRYYKRPKDDDHPTVIVPE